ncbi:MAG: tripartite tricarboxylate transporter substrate binding protein [Burkholderiaceae bacterium]|nr:tripartite tricarboxylate transporter substrate binding protein [Burkholderiaceae bacterium]
MNLNRLIGTALLAAASVAQAQAPAADYPSRPVRMVVGYPPGGTLDIVARNLANELQKELRQSFVVDNRAGAGGLVGAQAVLNAPRDGYTLLMAIGSHTVLPAIQPKMPYDTLTDFTPVMMVGTSPNMLVVRADHPARTLADFLQQAKASGQPPNYATPGVGTTTHVTAVMLERASGVPMNHVPFKGSADTNQALLAGQVPVAFASIVSAGPAIRDGRVRALGIVGEHRSALLPDVPTFAEGKVPGVLGNNWLGLLAPSGTPAAAVTRLSSAIAAIAARPEFQASLRAQGVEPQNLGQADFGRMLTSEVAAYKEVAKTAKMTND